MKKLNTIFLMAVVCLLLVACSGYIETNNSETPETENAFQQESGTNTNELAEAETVSQQGITEDDIVGTWMCELPYKQGGMGTPAFQMDLHKGGTGEGYEKRNGEIDKSKCYILKWEIKDDVIVISYTYDPLSWTFEMSEDKTRIIEVTSENSFVKNN